MSKNALVAPLMRVGLFHGLTPLQVTEIARHAERIVFKAGDVITEAGTDGDAAYLIVAGPAVRAGDAETDYQDLAIEAGSLVGEMAMLIEHEYGSRVVARGQVRALRITRAALHDQMLADPALAHHLMMRIVARLTVVADELRRIDDTLTVDRALPVAPAGLVRVAAADAGQRSQLTH